MDDVNLNDTSNGGDSSDDEVVVGVEEFTKAEMPENENSGSGSGFMAHVSYREDASLNELSTYVTKLNVADDVSLFRFDTDENEDLFGDQQLPEWVGWHEASDIQVDGSTDVSTQSNSTETVVTTASVSIVGELAIEGTVSASESVELAKAKETTPCLFEEDAEFVGVDIEVRRAMNGEVGAIKRNLVKVPELPKPHEDETARLEFSKSHWRMEPGVGVVQE
ncbi:hypothetical protein B296_00003961 [Ensete ventricosum]|uniref:Uncharacterized protein n=1 Tax=Ensete ventricosum TaxID=4639 RepID=A0A427B5G4_ENSVE|nr:hypothetical protein B296_00003961 [Ensete ventricosum]